MTEPILFTQNLTKSYHVGDSDVVALKQVSLDVSPGELIVVFGPSGCGKTTLLSLLAGLEKPTSGRVIVAGQDIYSLKPRELAKYRGTKVGMVFQQFNLIPSLNARDNVAMPLLLAGVSGRKARRRATELLGKFNMGNRAKHKPSQLSGGQQQRVAIARALIADPEILLLDEPTGNLDIPTGNEIIETIRQVNSDLGRTVILVTHNPEFQKYGNRVFFMEDGKLTKIQNNSNSDTKETILTPKPPTKRRGGLSAWESLKMARNHFMGKGLRTFLTTLGIVLGVSTIVALVSLGIGVQQITSDQLASFNTFVTIGITANPDSSHQLDSTAINQLKAVKNVTLVSPTISTAAKIADGSSTTEIMLNGVLQSALDFEGISLTSGQPYTSTGIILTQAAAKDLDTGNPSGVLGQNVQLSVVVVPKNTTSLQDSQIVTLNEKVVGISSDQVTPSGYMSYASLQSALPSAGISSIKVRVNNRNNVESVRNKINDMGYVTSSVVDLINQVDKIFLIAQIALGLIGSVALLVALIGIVNIMTVALLERTHEIGILKAIGATDADIKRIFMYEVLFFGLLGGTMGVLFAWGFGASINAIIDYLMRISHVAGAIKLFVTPLSFAIEMIVLTVLVSILGGWYPSKRASKLSPMEALRYE